MAPLSSDGRIGGPDRGWDRSIGLSLWGLRVEGLAELLGDTTSVAGFPG